MDKRKLGKVIPFPGLERRLADKGMDALVQKKFPEAASFLTKALEMNEEDYNTRFGLIVALIELGNYKEAKENCELLLKRGIGDYFKVMEMYVMILLQLNEYAELQETIHALLDDGHVPPDKEAQFENMLEFSRKMSKEKSNFPVDLEGLSDGTLGLLNKSYDEQAAIIVKLKNENIRRHIDEIKDYLQSPEGIPVIKTMLLNLLQEQGFDGPCDVEKFLKHRTVNPAQMEPMTERPFYKRIKELLEERLEHDNPTLLEHCLSLMERQHYVIFPFDDKKDYECWAASYHLLALQYQGLDEDPEGIKDLYAAEHIKADETLQFIYYIEEISSL